MFEMEAIPRLARYAHYPFPHHNSLLHPSAIIGSQPCGLIDLSGPVTHLAH